MCSGLFSSSAKRARPARHASASGWPTSSSAVWSDWTMRGLSEVKGLLLPAGYRQVEVPGPGRPCRLDAGEDEMPFVIPQAAPGIDAKPARLERLDLPRGSPAILRDVDDLDDHLLVDGHLDEVLDLARPLGGPAIEQLQIAHRLRARATAWANDRLRRRRPTGRRRTGLSQHAGKCGRLGRGEAEHGL